MSNPEINGGSPEKKGIGGKELKKISPETKHLSAEEKETLEKELLERGEKAKELIEKHNNEKNTENIKKERENTNKDRDSENDKLKRYESQQPQTDREKDVIYTKELKVLQKKMSPTQRTFSKVIHNSIIEKVSDSTQKTIFRPSALIGGAVSGLVLGILVYIVARIYGYSLGNLEILSLAFLGAILGLIIEFIVRKIKHKK